MRKMCDKCEGSGGYPLCDKHSEDPAGYETCDHCKTCEACDGFGYVIINDEPTDEQIYANDGMTASEYREVERMRINNQINNL